MNVNDRAHEDLSLEEAPSLDDLIAIVEAGLQAAGVDPEPCRTAEAGEWNLKTGSTEVWIDLYLSPDEGRAYFQVMSPIVFAPKEGGEGFYRELLDLNYRMVGAYFVTYKTGVYLKFMKNALHLTSDEVLDVLMRIGQYAPGFQKGFVERFGLQNLQHLDA